MVGCLHSSVLLQHNSEHRKVDRCLWYKIDNREYSLHKIHTNINVDLRDSSCDIEGQENVSEILLLVVSRENKWSIVAICWKNFS